MHENTPTTMNGPLHTDNINSDDRQITAIFDTESDAAGARDKLAAAGVATDRMTVQHAAEDTTFVASAHAPDRNILGKLRDAVFPDEGTGVQRDAVARGLYVLNVKPNSSDTEKVVGILQACNPSIFDARLQRWRNT